MNIELDDPQTKITHLTSDGKKKTLLQHIDEIKRITFMLLDKHFLYCESCKKIVIDLAEKHDLGKLNPDWSVYNEYRPPHSVLSAYLYLLENNYDPVIFYLIWKHHGFLNAPQYTRGYITQNILRYLHHKDVNITKEFQSKLYMLLKEDLSTIVRQKESYLQNILYADLFGIFKTADILSAKFEIELKTLKENLEYDNHEAIKDMLKQYVESKGLKFDESKWNLWIRIASTYNNVLLLAPTGWGKTFAAVIIALFSRPSHIIYVLPTITAIRKMKESLKNLFRDIDIEENYFFADIEILKGNDGGGLDNHPSTELFVAKTFLAPITVTTLDQIILSFLNVGKYHLKRYHFRNSFIIFDEYHIYPPQGLILLLRLLKKFNRDFGYNMKFLFMSATEEPTYTKLIRQNIKNIEKYEFLEEYKKLRRYKYKLLEKDIIDSDIINLIKRYSSDGKILIILNRVEKAIKMYLKLRKITSNILLLHSRYTYQDRRRKEEILEKLHKKQKKLIFIATQLAEVSLDMSFDYLFTEAAPLPSLIQRFGRVNRYKNCIAKINVFITYPSEIQTSRKYPYDKNLVIKSWNTLKSQLKDGEIENEYKLLEYILSGELKFEIGNVDIEIDNYFNKWMEDTGFIYTVDLTDEEMNRILKFRETNTALVIPGCKEKEVLEILSQDNKIKNILIKELFVPVPIWWLLEGRDSLNSIKNILMLSSKRFVYSPVVGYFDSQQINLPEDVEICKDNFIM